LRVAILTAHFKADFKDILTGVMRDQSFDDGEDLLLLVAW
jgi:hypothetical protein